MSAIGFAAGMPLRQGGGAGFAFTGPTLPPGATLARGSAASRYGPAGLETVAANTARFEVDPLTRAPMGVLIEPARANALAWSEAFGQVVGGWSPGAVAVVGDAAVAPNGATAADKVIPDTSAVIHSVGSASPAEIGATYAVSVFAKSAGYDCVAIRGLGLGGGGGARFNLATGTVTQVAGYSAAAVTAVGGGWFRLTAIGVAAQTAGAIFDVSGVDAVGAFAGNGIAGVLLWGAQMEVGATPSSYIATGASPATRGADVLTLDWGGRGVADGVRTIRYGFDDGTAQDVATAISGGVAAVPTDLRRARLIRATLA